MFSSLWVLYLTADQLCLDSNLHEGKDNISFASQCVQSQPSLEGGRAVNSVERDSMGPPKEDAGGQMPGKHLVNVDF